MTDLATFAAPHLDSGDIDPAYPVLAAIADDRGYSWAEKADLIFLYVAYYNIASALVIAEEGPWPPFAFLADYLKQPTGTERRAHRSPRRLYAHLVALDQQREAYGDLACWIAARCAADSYEDNWRNLQAALRSIDGNGRWAAYKTGELLAYFGWPVRPTDAGHDFSTGPRQGLALVRPEALGLEGHSPGVVAALDEMTEEVRVDLSDRLERDVPVEQLETILCDWHSTVAGRYYVGHDIDQQLEQVAGAPDSVRSCVLAARERAFAPRWLGEVNGWSGVRRPLKRLWAAKREVAWW